MEKEKIYKYVIYDSKRKEFYGENFCGYTIMLCEIGMFTMEKIYEFQQRSFANIKVCCDYEKALKTKDGCCYAVPYISIELR